jgi:hypothetical protein
MTASNFDSAANIQALAKDAVVDTCRRINGIRNDWPFNAVEHTQVLTIGVNEYAWPSQFSEADWLSFQLQKDDTLGVPYRQLKHIEREQWYTYFRDEDYDNLSTGLRAPEYCFPSHGAGFGVSPIPDKAYTIKYRYYSTPTDLSIYTDQPTIPSKFDYVIINGALAMMNMFRENNDGFTAMEKAFKDGLDDLTRTYLPNPEHLYEGRVNFGGGNHNSWVWKGM